MGSACPTLRRTGSIEARRRAACRIHHEESASEKKIFNHGRHGSTRKNSFKQKVTKETKNTGNHHASAVFNHRALWTTTADPSGRFELFRTVALGWILSLRYRFLLFKVCLPGPGEAWEYQETKSARQDSAAATFDFLFNAREYDSRPRPARLRRIWPGISRCALPRTASALGRG